MLVSAAALFCSTGVAQAKIRVAATITDLAAIAREIGGTSVEVTALSSQNQDPHFVDPKPNLVLAINRADLLLMVGLELEIGWLPTLIIQSRNPRVQSGAAGHLDCSQFVDPLDVPARVDRSMGDIHPGGNPHYFHDPRAMLNVAEGIAARMTRIDPASAAEHRKGLDAFTRRLEKARIGWEQRLARYRGAPVISYHKSWTYLLDWLGLKSAGYLEPKPGVPPTASHVAALLGGARRDGVKIIVREVFYQDSMTRLLAAQLGAQIAALPAGANFGAGQSYAERIDEMIGSLEAALLVATKGAK